MSDPIREFIDNGGFRAVSDPAGEKTRLKADALTRVLVHSYLGQDAPPVDGPQSELLDGIIGAGELGSGQLASLQLLGQMWRDLVSTPMTFTPPQATDPLVLTAADVASAMTGPTSAVPLAAVQDRQVAEAAIVILAYNLAARLRSAREMLAVLDRNASAFWDTH